MQKIVITFITLSAIFVSTLFASAETIDERKIDIYFGNGVWNTYDQAKEGQKELNKEVSEIL